MTQVIDWTGFALAVLLIEVTPGPNMAWLAGLSLSHGKRAGLAATAGIALGLLLNGFVAAAGFAALVAERPEWMRAIRYAGTVFMLFLAWQAWRDSGESSQAAVPVSAKPRAQFVSGFVTNLLNPKALLFFVVVVPQFIRGAPPSLAQAFGFTLISAAIATTIHAGIVLAAARVHDNIADPARTRTLRRMLALVLVGVALWFALG